MIFSEKREYPKEIEDLIEIGFELDSVIDGYIHKFSLEKSIKVEDIGYLKNAVTSFSSDRNRLLIVTLEFLLKEEDLSVLTIKNSDGITINGKVRKDFSFRSTDRISEYNQIILPLLREKKFKDLNIL